MPHYQYKAIDASGLDSVELFRQAGMDHSKLRDPLARFPARGVDRLWVLAENAIQDPAFGLNVASYWHPTSLHALGYSWLASDNRCFFFILSLTRSDDGIS